MTPTNPAGATPVRKRKVDIFGNRPIIVDI